MRPGDACAAVQNMIFLLLLAAINKRCILVPR
jgi:hypothetical protein